MSKLPKAIPKNNGTARLMNSSTSQNSTLGLLSIVFRVGYICFASKTHLFVKATGLKTRHQ